MLEISISLKHKFHAAITQGCLTKKSELGYMSF
jgi:hypothetical protein